MTATGGSGGSVAWADITGKPTTFTPSSHTHKISEITGLQTALNGKAALTHTHAASDITSGVLATARLGTGTASSSTYLRGDGTWSTITTGSTYTAGTGIDITGSVISNTITNNNQLANGAGYITSSSLTWTNITGKPTTFTPSAHSHSISEVTGLQTALDGKQGTITTGTALQYLKGDLSLGTFPTALSAFTNDAGFITSSSLLWTNITGIPSTFTPSAHNHAASEITSGVLSTARLGTGSANAGTVLYGDGTWKNAPSFAIPTLQDVIFQSGSVIAGDIITDSNYLSIGDTENSAGGSYIRVGGDESMMEVRFPSPDAYFTFSNEYISFGSPTGGASLQFTTSASGSNWILPSSSGTLALTSQIPTNTTQLSNGAGFITSASLTWSNITSKPNSGNFIYNTTSLQAGSSFNVVDGYLQYLQMDKGNGAGYITLNAGNGDYGSLDIYFSDIGGNGFPSAFFKLNPEDGFIAGVGTNNFSFNGTTTGIGGLITMTSLSGIGTRMVVVDSSGFYQFSKLPEKTVEDNFDGPSGRTCADGSDGDSPWASNWTDPGDASSGFCQSVANADVEIVPDGSFGYVLRLKDVSKEARRSVNLSGATRAFLSFSYRRKNPLAATESVFVQASSNGTAFTTIYTITGGGSDANYVTIYNQDITSYASATSAIRFMTNSDVDDNDTIYIDNVSVRYLKYPQCYITRVDTLSLPTSYKVTTTSFKTVNIASGGSCTSRFDFGFSKPNITISGRLRRDANGLKDNLVNGSNLGRMDGVPVYAYLADPNGTIAFKTTLNATNGTYSFASAEITSQYIVRLSTINTTVGSPLPASLAAPDGWVSVGESYGINNTAGTGPEAGISDAAIPVHSGLSNVTNVDFSVEMIPETDHYLRSVNQPRVNDMITMNGRGANPPILSGADPEDCLSGCNITGKTVIIDTVPSNSELYYNNALIVDGQVISNFNPDLFQIRVTSAAIGDITIRFSYSFVDAAGVKDPSPATYTVMWGIVLPAEGLIASVNLNDDVATINWQTLTEENTSYFEVEQSFDNTTFEAVSDKIDAAGSSVTKKNYKATDNIKNVDKPIVYYRIRLVDNNGKVSYSNIVAVRLSKKPGVAVWPNPFQSTITVSVTTIKETTIDVKLIDVNGQTLYTSSQKAAKGITRVTISDLQKLPSGVYLVEITDRSAGATFQKLIKNN
ncbi:MAG: T9SS type A sorting domain-containing protein [Chitinophagaceae bacterium]|nr:MAG: T9SS type A sorting domain-containing protein [Chitinophagaceae bacterium]